MISFNRGRVLHWMMLERMECSTKSEMVSSMQIKRRRKQLVLIPRLEDAAAMFGYVSLLHISTSTMRLGKLRDNLL